MLIPYYLAANISHCRFILVPCCFWIATNNNPYDTLHLIFEKNGDFGSTLKIDASNDHFIYMQQEGDYVTL